MSETINAKPQTVRKAVLILYATLAVGIIRSIMEFPRMVEQSAAVGYGAWFVIFIQVFTFIIMGLLFFLIDNRKNWARILFVVLGILGVPFSIAPFIKSLTAEPISGLLGLMQTVAEVIALILLFKKPSNEWFTKTNKYSQSSIEE